MQELPHEPEGSLIRALLFDFDGTLWDSEVAPFTLWQETYRRYDQELSLEDWAAAIGTYGGFDALAELERRTGLALDRDTIVEERRRRKAELLSELEPRPGVIEYLDEARRVGLKLGIVSSDDSEWIADGLRHLGLTEGWDLIECAEKDRTRAKPEPTLYLTALQRLGLRAPEAIAIEDSPNGIHAAKRAGLFCLAVANTVTVNLDLSEADLVVDSLEGLPLDDLLDLAGGVDYAGGQVLNDPKIVAAEYASEDRLAIRRRAWSMFREGPSDDEATFDAVAELPPTRVLEVGCGWGELAERIARELPHKVIASDLSPRMTFLAQQLGLPTFVADAQALSVADSSFGCVVANSMLYHVPDFNRALGEIARVLQEGGTLVATTFGRDNLRVLRLLIGAPPVLPLSFSAENGEELLLQYFHHVETRLGRTALVFPNAAEVRAYVASTFWGRDRAHLVPELSEPLRADRSFAVFIATEPRD